MARVLLAASTTGFVFWLVTPRVLLGRLDWQRLLPGAIVCGVSAGVLNIVSQIWVPLLLKWSADRYGLIGVAFSIQTWLLVYAFIVVVAAVFGATLGEEEEVTA